MLQFHNSLFITFANIPKLRGLRQIISQNNKNHINSQKIVGMKNLFAAFLLMLFYNQYAQTKIICEEVKLATKPLSEVTYVKAIEKRIGGRFEACELNLRNKMFVETEIHPFVSALYYAYADHRKISISPDMIWLLICQGFSTHVNVNPEKFRTKLVTFNNKKKIIVNTQSISNDFKKGSINSPWPLAFPVMADSISKYVKSDVHNLYVQKFTTTSYIEKAAYEIALLDVMSGYFEYEYATACGIPEIIIEGTKEDWQKIKNKLNSFRGYDIDNWIDSLEPIMQQFINASENKIDNDFWANIFKQKEESGGPYITGWIIKFFPYVNYGNHEMIKNPYINREPKDFMEGLTTNQFNNGLSKVDFNWNYYDNTYEMEFLAGFVGIKQDKKSLTLRPEIGWLVKEKKSNNKKLIQKEEYFLTNWKIYLTVFLGIFCIGISIVYIARKK